jgi:DNA-binding LytR/AlgR family response regulator
MISTTTKQEKTVPVGARTSLLPSEIVLMTADENYTVIHLSNGKKMTVSYNLGKIHERLFSHVYFVRVNRKTLVNLQFVHGFCSDSLIIEDRLIPFSRRRKDAVLLILESTYGSRLHSDN